MKNNSTFLLIIFLLTKATDIYAAYSKKISDDVVEEESWSIPNHLMNKEYQNKYPKKGILWDKKVKIKDLLEDNNLPEKWGFYETDDDDDEAIPTEEKKEEMIKQSLILVKYLLVLYYLIKI